MALVLERNYVRRCIRCGAGKVEVDGLHRLLTKHGIEVGGGLGALAGKVWRIGLMGYNSREENVDLLLNLLEQELPAFRSAAPVAAAAAA